MSLYVINANVSAGKWQHGKEVIRSVGINLESPSIGSGHVLYEGAGRSECDELRAAVGEKLVCVPVRKQPTYYDFLSYAAVTLTDALVLLTNPDIVYDAGDLENIRPELINASTMFTFSVRPPPLELLQRTTTSSGFAQNCVRDKSKVAVDYCFATDTHFATRCAAQGHAGPCSWDGYLFRPPTDLPPAARRLRFPMNVLAAEAYATNVFRHDLGFRVRQGCHFVRAYNCHCAPKTNQDTTSRWPGRMWQYDLDTMVYNTSLNVSLPLIPPTCGERSADLPTDPAGKALTARCIKLLVDKYGRSHDAMEATLLSARQRGERHVDDDCMVLYAPFVACPELGDQQRSWEQGKPLSHLAAAQLPHQQSAPQLVNAPPRFGR